MSDVGVPDVRPSLDKPHIELGDGHAAPIRANAVVIHSSTFAIQLLRPIVKLVDLRDYMLS